MKTNHMKELIRDGRAVMLNLRIGQLIFYQNHIYRKNGNDYEMIEDDNLTDFLIGEYGL